MKKVVSILSIMLVLVGCKEEWGSIALNMQYNCEKPLEKGMFQIKDSETLYTQYGDYITSITPTVFIGKFLDMRLFNFSQGSNMWNYGFNIIDNNTPIEDPNRLADFINQSNVNFNLDPNVLPADENGEFNILVFLNLFYFQEFDLLSQYENITLMHLGLEPGVFDYNFDGQFVNGCRNGVNVKCGSDFLMYPIFDSTLSGFSTEKIIKCFVFGSSDSTYTYFSNTMNQHSIDNPLGQYGYILRSSAFNTIILEKPEDGESTIINGSMNFDTENIIQIYAGADNIPYTSDDVFIYAPKFWERLSVTMSVN
jgi:hypothetical protein